MALAFYNALEVDVRRSFANGFQLRGNYTWSKNLDDGSAWNTSVSGNTPAFVEFPLQPKARLGPGGDRRPPVGLDQRQLRPALRPEPALPQPLLRARRLHRRRLDGERHPGRADRLSVLAAAWLQPARQRRLAQSHPAQLESSLQRQSLSAHGGPILQSQRVHPATVSVPNGSGGNTIYGTYGNVKRDSLPGPGLTELDFSAVKNTHITERLEPAVPRRVLQHPQPHQFPHAERGRVFLGATITSSGGVKRDSFGNFAHGGRGHGHVHHVAADSVRRQVAVLGDRPIGRSGQTKLPMVLKDEQTSTCTHAEHHLELILAGVAPNSPKDAHVFAGTATCVMCCRATGRLRGHAAGTYRSHAAIFVANLRSR